ncbi:hypothetical protein NW755_006565 [Fusarium falciforme]|uniref:Enoyl reductase (ER) domain-containing protein n=1 Tax=Fusarium falciforme TaxID=195108 RepID=A0A9W8R5C3_9HYPO|nr:hypothetical protein NW755_006565 [Fusarium falciforme]
MKEAIVSFDQRPLVDVRDVPVPTPRAGQVLIRVIVCGSNPKDVKSALYLPPQNFGDDIAGIIEDVGEGVTEFRKGDRVAAFHEMFTPHGAFAEYSIAWARSTFHIPENVSFEEAATVPLTAMTAAIGLYRDLGLPPPWSTDEDRPETGPLVVYGAGAAVGAFAVQLACKSGVHPIIAVAGQSKDHVETLIDRNKGDTIIDYRLGPDVTVAEIKKALKGAFLHHAFDSIGDHGSDKILGAVLEPDSKLSMVLPRDKARIPKTPGVPWPAGFVAPALEGLAEDTQVFWTAVGSIHGAYKEFGYIYFRYFSLGLQEGWLRSHPYEVVPGGLDGLAEGLTRLLEGKAHAVKFVYRISETFGASE